MSVDRPIASRNPSSRKRRGWGRSLLIAILLHVVLGFTLWRIAVRLHVGLSVTPTALTADPPRPIILQAMESIHSSPAPAPLAAYQEQGPAVEWANRRHRWIEADWTTENAPLIGHSTSLKDLAVPVFKRKPLPPIANNPDLQK